MDFLPIENSAVKQDWPNMYWRQAEDTQRCKGHKSNHLLHAVYIGNFSCGPDSFIIKFLRKRCRKPYLHLELDAHSADAGPSPGVRLSWTA